MSLQRKKRLEYGINVLQCIYIGSTSQPKELVIWQKQLQFQPELTRV